MRESRWLYWVFSAALTALTVAALLGGMSSWWWPPGIVCANLAVGWTFSPAYDEAARAATLWRVELWSSALWAAAFAAAWLAGWPAWACWALAAWAVADVGLAAARDLR